MKEIELWGMIQGNETQKTILVLLRKNKSLYQSEIARRIDKAQPTVHHHVDFLQKNKLVQSSKVGKYSIYYLTELGEKFADELLNKAISDEIA